MINVYDIAVFLATIDLPYLDERDMIQRLHFDLNTQESLTDFMIKVDEQIELLDTQVVKEMSQMKIELISCHFEKDMAHYLKVMKLRMQYTEADYVKIKLRTLLKQLGYKRRSDKLVSELIEMFHELGLVVFKKGGILAELSELPLDEFMTIRLRSESDV